MELDTVTLVLLLAPLVLLEASLKLWALWALWKAERVRWDNKAVWAAIILLVNLFGAVAFLLVGREEP